MILDDFKPEAKGTLQFSLSPKQGYKLQWERYYISEQIERIKVFGKEREMKLQCNRPYLKLNERKKPIQWKIISPISQEIYKYPIFINTVFIELERALDDADFNINPRTIVEQIKRSRGK